MTTEAYRRLPKSLTADGKPRRRSGLFRTITCVVLSIQLLAACNWFLSAEDRINRAKQSIADGNDRGAVIELQNALSKEPANIPARLLLAETSLRMGDIRSTDAELERAESDGASETQTARVLADLRLAKNDNAAFLQDLEANRVPMKEPLLSIYRGRVLRALNRREEAKAAFQKAIGIESKSSDARLGLADVLASTGNTSDALRELELLIANDAQNARAWLTKGSIEASLARYPEAVRSLVKAKSNAAGQLSAMSYYMLLAALVEAQVASGSLDDARATHADIVKRAPDAPLTNLVAARIAMAASDYSTAVVTAQRALTAAPDLAEAKLLLGAALLAQGNLNQAAAQLTEFVQAVPENVEARKLLAQAYLRMQRADAAVAVLAPLRETESDDAQLNALLGWTNLLQGQEVEAISRLERGLGTQPQNTGLKLNLAMAYLRADQAEKAVPLLRSLNPTSPYEISRRDMLLVAAVGASRGRAAARAEIDRLTEASVKDAAMLSTVARLYSLYGEVTKGREAAHKALALEPNNVASLMSAAWIEIQARDIAASKVLLDRALKIEPHNPQLLTARAQIALQTGEGEAAIKLLEQVRAKDADARSARLLLARTYLSQKKPAEADRIVGELLKEGGNTGQTNEEIGRLYLDGGRYDRALTHFQTAARTEPTDPTHFLSAARAQLALNDAAGAQTSVEQAIKVRPDFIAAHSMAVMLELRGGKQGAADMRVAALKKAQPDDPDVLLLEGDLALAKQLFAEAAIAYGKANKLSPTRTSAMREYRARTLGRLANPSDPLVTWLRQQPEDVTVRMALAESYASRGEAAKAIEQYEMLVASESPDVMAMNNLAWLYHERGDDRAIRLAERAYELAPNVSGVADTYGWILVSSGSVKEGLPILKAAAASMESSPEIRYHYAFALAKAGDASSARSQLQALLRESKGNPIDDEARRLLAELGG